LIKGIIILVLLTIIKLNYDKAIEAYKQAIKIRSDFAEVYCALGLPTNAFKGIQDIKELDPDLAGKLFTLINL
jgi:tetratricopeptide (TPR) repeat protein